MARTRILGIPDPLDPSNPIIERRLLDPNLPWFFFGKDRPPNPLEGWGPLPSLDKARPSDKEKPALPPIPEPPAPPKTLWPSGTIPSPMGVPYLNETRSAERTRGTPFIAAGSVPGGVRGVTRGAGYLGSAVVPQVSFVPGAPQGAPGGLLGLMIEAGFDDPLNPDAPLPGGLAGFIREHLRDTSKGN